MSRPKVSVIVAAYNLKDVIAGSIETIQSQTFSDFEIIVCDDCSTDGTWEALQSLASADTRIVLLQNGENRGQAYTRNRCFEQACGDYFAIHDGDDRSAPRRLETEAAFLDSHPEYDFVSGQMRTFDDAGRFTANPVKPGDRTKADFLWGIPFPHAPTMFRRESILRVGGYAVDEATRYRCEDYDLFSRQYALGMRGYVLEAHLYDYYVGADAVGRRKYRYRISEARVRFRIYRRLGLFPKGIVYVLKPLLVGLLPQKWIRGLKRT